MQGILAFQGEKLAEKKLAGCKRQLSHRGETALLDGKKGFKLALDGELFRWTEKELENLIREQLETGNPETLAKALINEAGFFALAFQHKNKIYALRDFFGVKPLWYGGQKKIKVIASEPKVLKEEFDLAFPAPLKPGHLLILDENGFQEKEVYTLLNFVKRMPRRAEKEKLKERFLKGVGVMSQGSQKAAVLFSGGVDSTLVAAALKHLGKEVTLITVGLEGSHDLQESRNVARELGLKLKLRPIEKKEVEPYALKTTRLLGFYDSLQVPIGLPELVALEEAKRLGFKSVFVGQGSDEIFAGYSSFKKVYKEKGADGVQEETWFALTNSWQRNFYRDEILAASQGIELKLPFLYRPFVRQAMALHPSEKIKSADDEVRKHAVRELAMELGVPKELAMRRKKAIQYGSGVAKELKKLFKG